MPITYSQAYYDAYLHLPEDLAAQYTHKRLDNHCYLRIALDNTIGAKWDNQIKRPAYKNITPEQRKQVLDLLRQYQSDEELLDAHNRQSLVYRKKNRG